MGSKTLIWGASDLISGVPMTTLLISILLQLISNQSKCLDFPHLNRLLTSLLRAPPREMILGNLLKDWSEASGWPLGLGIQPCLPVMSYAILQKSCRVGG